MAVFGCGPVGLMAMRAARVMGARHIIAVDVLNYRIKTAEKVAGATGVNPHHYDPVKAIRELTHGRGADACIDAVGMEAEHGFMESASNLLHVQVGTMKTLRTAMRAVRRGGTVSVVGVYGTDFDNFPLGQLFDKAITLRGGQAPVQARMDKLLSLVSEGKLYADDIVTHRVPLGAGPQAYEMFNDKKDKVVKLMLTP